MTRSRLRPVSEDWRDLPFAGYQASTWGRIRSVDRTLSDGRQCGGVILAPSIDANGYHRVTLHVGGKLRTVPVHVLVAAAFIGPRPPRREVLHWDDVRAHNWPGNLRYGTRRQNERDKARNRLARLRGLSQ